jgi:NAD(P)H-dependent flavin oxidoreductase YrpB (nitropropane dioxygenase family)
MITLAELDVRESALLLCKLVCEEGVKSVETPGYSPGPIMPKLNEAGLNMIHKLTSVRQTETSKRIRVNAVTSIAFGSGSHIGLNNTTSFILILLAVWRLDSPLVQGGLLPMERGF